MRVDPLTLVSDTDSYNYKEFKSKGNCGAIGIRADAETSSSDRLWGRWQGGRGGVSVQT